MKTYEEKCEEKCKEKHDEYEKFDQRNPVVPSNTATGTQWFSKKIVVDLLNQPGRYFLEIGFRPDGVVIWRESTKKL